MKGITKEVIEQDYKTIKEMLAKYSNAVYENQEGQPAHFDNQPKLCKILICDIRCGLNIVNGAI